MHLLQYPEVTNSLTVYLHPPLSLRSIRHATGFTQSKCADTHHLNQPPSCLYPWLATELIAEVHQLKDQRGLQLLKNPQFVYKGFHSDASIMALPAYLWFVYPVVRNLRVETNGWLFQQRALFGEINMEGHSAWTSKNWRYIHGFVITSLLLFGKLSSSNIQH